MRAIRVHYLPPTNTRGSRLKATAGRCSVTVQYPDEASDEAAFAQAALALCAKFGWRGDLIGGGLETAGGIGEGWVFVFATGTVHANPTREAVPQ